MNVCEYSLVQDSINPLETNSEFGIRIITYAWLSIPKSLSRFTALATLFIRSNSMGFLSLGSYERFCLREDLLVVGFIGFNDGTRSDFGQAVPVYEKKLTELIDFKISRAGSFSNKQNNESHWH